MAIGKVNKNGTLNDGAFYSIQDVNELLKGYVKKDEPTPPTPPTPVSITVSPKTLTLKEGYTDYIDFTVVPSDLEVSWGGYDEDIILVMDDPDYPNGLYVEGRMAGETTVTVSAVVDGVTYSDSCTVTVTEPAPTPSIRLSDSSLNQTFWTGDTTGVEWPITATTVPAGQTVTWSSTDDTVASVDQDGVVTVKPKDGVAQIDAVMTYDDVEYSAFCAIYVNVEDPEAEWDEESATIEVGDTTDISITLSAPSGTPITCTSSDNTVASVELSGHTATITGVGEGDCTIYATIEYPAGSGTTYSNPLSVTVTAAQ